MYVEEIKINNFKCFKGEFRLTLNEELNILVGDNEAGKSTIIEAINLALTGLFNGRYIKNELSQYLFNNEVVAEYLVKINKGESVDLPSITIELFMSGEELATLEGDGNSLGEKKSGVSFRIAFDPKYQAEYEELVKSKEVKSIPIEYYDVFWTSFARDNITARSIPLKPAVIDSSSNRYQNGSDVYISRIIRDSLEEKDKVNVSQAHRKMIEAFMDDDAIQVINKKIEDDSGISDKKVKLSVELSSKNAWESSLMTYLDDVPFHYIGKGEQCIVKTKLALSHKKCKEANILLLEEPENHLSHTKLNQLIKDIKTGDDCKQIVVATHSSFVANKLGLGSLILLNNQKTVKLDDLKEDTKKFFEKLAGYDTLRLILCKKAILVEGDSDELIIQKAFLEKNDGKLPIETGIDVISVGTSFLRFLEIAEKIQKPVAVVTDNDGDVDAIKRKYSDYLGDNKKDFIEIYFDETVDSGSLDSFNYNTLEPKLLKANSLQVFNKVFETDYSIDDELLKYMKANKTECAIRIFDTTDAINFPNYITNAIE